MIGGESIDWDLLYAQIIAATGWNWDEVDALTIPRCRALVRYWRDYPPVHLLLRTLVAWPPLAESAARRREAPAPFATLISLAPGGT